jgi:hypothetical protein
MLCSLFIFTQIKLTCTLSMQGWNEIFPPRLTQAHTYWKELKRPLIICVASKRAGSELEDNIQSLNLTEGVDFFRFN